MSTPNPFKHAPGEDAEDGWFVCHGCVGESHLKGEIRRWGKAVACRYCGGTRKRSVSVAGFAQRVDLVYRQMVSIAPDMPQAWAEDDRVTYVEAGSSPGMVMAELIECDDTSLADDVIAYLGRYNQFDIADGGPDWYDDASEQYRLSLPDDPRFSEAWDTFCRSLKFERRFFNAAATHLLDEIFGPILGSESARFSSAVRTIGPVSPDRFIFRARLANDETARREIYGAPRKNLGAPPSHRAVAGRMNATGIPAFYGSTDAETAVAELRAPVGGEAVVGKFEIVQPLRILDLTSFERGQKNALSWFHPDFAQVHNFIRFVPGFHRDIKKPVIPGQEALDYLPTQVVAEYLWTREGSRKLDGLIFGSAQASPKHKNIVIFPHACRIEGAGDEAPREVSWIGRAASAPDDDDEDRVETVYLKKIDPKTTPAPVQPVAFEGAGDWFADYEAKHEALLSKKAPALRLDPKGIQLMRIWSISYDLEARQVQFDEDRLGDIDDADAPF